MALFWVTVLASARVIGSVFPSGIPAENSTSTAFIAFRRSPPQAPAMYSKAPSSGAAFSAVRSSKKRTARFTACSAAEAEICLNSNTVERLRMALNT